MIRFCSSILYSNKGSLPSFTGLCRFSTSIKREERRKVAVKDEFDEEQVKFMNEEFCLLIDRKDNLIDTKGSSKKDCHLLVGSEKDNIFDRSRLHRAFSVFLFNSKNELLLQKRASTKITFPNLWTNTCCSHPLTNEGLGETQGLEGIKRAAIRKLGHELGIDRTVLDMSNFEFLTRIHYAALNQPDQRWVENEIDYILIYKDKFDAILPSLSPNPNEVGETSWCSLKDIFKEEEDGLLVSQISTHTSKFTPWFSLIANHREYLGYWWRLLDANISFKEGPLYEQQQATIYTQQPLYEFDNPARPASERSRKQRPTFDNPILQYIEKTSD